MRISSTNAVTKYNCSELVVQLSLILLPLDYVRTGSAFAIISLLIMMLGHIFAFYTLRRPRYIVKRLTSLMHFMTGMEKNITSQNIDPERARICILRLRMFRIKLTINTIYIWYLLEMRRSFFSRRHLFFIDINTYDLFLCVCTSYIFFIYRYLHVHWLLKWVKSV